MNIRDDNLSESLQKVVEFQAPEIIQSKSQNEISKTNINPIVEEKMREEERLRTEEAKSQAAITEDNDTSRKGSTWFFKYSHIVFLRQLIRNRPSEGEELQMIDEKSESTMKRLDTPDEDSVSEDRSVEEEKPSTFSITY